MEDAIVLAIDELEQGNTIEQILARYPEHASELLPVLKAAQQLANLKLAPSAEAKANSRRAFLTRAAALSGKPAVVRNWANPLRLLARLVAPAAIVIAVLVFGFYALTQSALPGQSLYGDKIRIEAFRLAQVQDPDALARLADEFEQRRREEVQDLLMRGIEADVMFGDIIAGIEGQRWELESTIPVQLSDDTVVRGRPDVGRYAHVIGRTANGVVMAGTVRVDMPLAPGPETLPEATETPEPTELPATTDTVTPTATQTPAPTKTTTMTPSPEPSATPSATPTSTVTPTSTLTPTVTATPTGSPTPNATTEASPTPDDDSSDDDGSDDGPPDDGSDDGSDHSGVEPGG